MAKDPLIRDDLIDIPDHVWEANSAERERRKKIAAAAKDAKLDVAAAAAIRWGFMRLKAREKLGADLAAISHQSLPRETLLAKSAELSETEVSNIKQAVAEACEKAGK